LNKEQNRQQTNTKSKYTQGTCKMSKGSDAVVDSRLKVIGVQGLRVADASIMPYIVSGNTNMAAIVIGGRGLFLFV